MTLYTIDESIRDLFDAETGELQEGAEELLEQLTMEREQKMENIACYIKNLAAEAAAIKAEIDVFNERKKRCERKKESLERLLRDALQGQKFSTPKCAVSFRKGTKLVITDEAECLSYLQEAHPDCIRLSKPEISKDAVKKLIKTGVFISGAELAETLSVGVK